jgi:hypothetical protein
MHLKGSNGEECQRAFVIRSRQSFNGCQHQDEALRRAIDVEMLSDKYEYCP